MAEAYFRIVKKCFTSSDVKVDGGLGRQFDLLAISPHTGEQFHIEVSVKHCAGFNYTLDELMKKADRKFFGAPKLPGQKNCLEAIKEAYKSVGFDFNHVTRVWIPWIINDDSSVESVNVSFAGLARRYGIRKPKFELILFRDRLLPELMQSIGKSDYNDSVIRTLSLISISQKQKSARASRSLARE